MKRKKNTKNPLAKFTNEELFAELARRNADTGRVDMTVDGFSAKDLVCMEGNAETSRGYIDSNNKEYQFYLRVDGKLFDVYYQTCMAGDYNARQNTEPSRWPSSDGALGLIPTEFVEASENSYEYHGKIPVADCLKLYGIEFRVWNPTLDKGRDGDKNYE